MLAALGSSIQYDPVKNLLQTECVKGLIFTFPSAFPSSLNLLSRDFHKTIIQTQVMPDGVLPALLILPVVGKVVHYKPRSTAILSLNLSPLKGGL